MNDVQRSGLPISNVRQLQALAEDRADETAYVHLAMDGTERSVTWAELDRRSSQVAAEIARRGVEFGDRVGLGIRNSPEFVFGVFATWKLGAVPVPVRWDVPDWELERLREVIEPTVYIGPDDLTWIAATADDPVPDLPDAVSPNTSGICSSGSTGTPKIILSQAPAVFVPAMGAPIAGVFMQVTRPQRILVLAPMYHINAFATLTSMLAGDTLYVLEKFDAARIVDAIEQHALTTFTATPTMLQRIADLPGVDDRDLSSIEWIMQGAAPMPPSLVHRWAALIGAEKIIMAYGSTEGLGLTVLDGVEWLQHEGSVGRGFAGRRVADSRRRRQRSPCGRDSGTSSSGHRTTVARPTSVTAPQLNMTPDGFGTVGDMGYVDDDGYLYLVDRRVDLIITGGANVFPAEVEAALSDHPKIADVVVIGLKDAEWGRRVHAIIEPANPADPPTFDEVRAYAKQRLIAYKVPKSVEIVEAIPRSEAMKVNRGRLVEAREA